MVSPRRVLFALLLPRYRVIPDALSMLGSLLDGWPVEYRSRSSRLALRVMNFLVLMNVLIFRSVILKCVCYFVHLIRKRISMYEEFTR